MVNEEASNFIEIVTVHMDLIHMEETTMTMTLTVLTLMTRVLATLMDHTIPMLQEINTAPQ